jgi:hypothetical protein
MVFLDINEIIPKTIITQEMTASAIFALWQCMYEPSSFWGHWKINAAINKMIDMMVMIILLIFFIKQIDLFSSFIVCG